MRLPVPLEAKGSFTAINAEDAQVVAPLAE
jgi:hypothetical protein